MTLELTGLDGQNPLGYFAALGLLRILDDDAGRRDVAAPRLRWTDQGPPFAQLEIDLDLDAVCEVVLEDARAQGDNRALQLAYTADELVHPDHADATRDLKPPPSVARELLDLCAGRSRRESGLAAAFFSELVQDNKGNTKPTALHFTAGQQTFLSMVDDLRRGISREDLKEALLGPWSNRSELPSLSWDASVARNYALRASDPSKEKRGSVPGANWLAVVALELYPVVHARGRLVTTGVTGGWKDSVLRWPLWSGAQTIRTIASLLRCDFVRWTANQREAVGVTTVYAAGILRSDQGGYGSFSPASIVLPQSTR